MHERFSSQGVKQEFVRLAGVNQLVIAVCVFVCVVVVGRGGRVVTPACRILPGKALPPLRLWCVYHKIRGVHLSPFWGKHPPIPRPNTHTHSVSYRYELQKARVLYLFTGLKSHHCTHFVLQQPDASECPPVQLHGQKQLFVTRVIPCLPCTILFADTYTWHCTATAWQLST